ncbi:MAG: ATP synthase F1 subunit delta [Mangrovibacterium sp.]
MDQSKITVRYAKAFFDLAKEQQQLGILQQDISIIISLIKESADFRQFLESPVIKTSVKLKLLNSIFEGKINKASLNFLHLVTNNKRESHLLGICRNILSLYRHEQGIKTAVLTSTVALNPDIINNIKKQLEQEFDAQIDLLEKTDSRLIGGFILRIDDQQLDASLSNQLRRVKETLLQSDIH